MSTNDFFQNIQTSAGENLIDVAENVKTNADIVFAIDATDSMKPMLDTVKKMAMNLYDDLVEGLKKFNREINQCRAKVIVFRDYFYDGKFAMEESDFFFLPDENEKFKEFVSGIEDKGGGDDPESSLEALALAMKSDWVQEGASKRHIIVMFTDQSAHKLEEAKEVFKKAGKKNPIYPNEMLQSYNEVYEAWSGNNNPQSNCGDNLMENEKKINPDFIMDKKARRLVLFTPDSDPWSDIAQDFEQCIQSTVIPGQGCSEIDNSIIITTLCKSMN